MSKITLSPLSGGYASVQAINARLQQIEDALNDNVVWRDGFTTEPNEMNVDLDMNGFDILNVSAFTATYVYLGAHPSAPTTNSVGAPLGAEDVGNIYFNSTTNVTWIWDGGVWVTIGTAQNSAGSVTIADAPANFSAATNVEAAVEEVFEGSTKNSTIDGIETLENKTIVLPVINDGVSGSAIDTDGTLAANSDTLLASQKAVKAYVDNLPPDSGNKYLIESRWCSGTHTQEFPSVFDNPVPGVLFHKFVIEYEDINFSLDSQEFAFQLTYNNGVAWSATGYRPEQDSYIYHSIIKDADYIFYTGCAGLDGETIVNNSGISSYTRMETKVNYPHFVAGAPNQYNKFHHRGHSHDVTGNPTGFRVFQDTGAGPGINPIGTFTGYIKVYGIIA